MSSSRPPRQLSAAVQRLMVDAIEWEELPSLVKRLQRSPPSPAGRAAGDPSGSAVAGDAPWGDTAPGGMDTVPASLPFVESLHGLAMREVIEPDVFRHFFGPDAE
jgi:hypothetical protein